MTLQFYRNFFFKSSACELWIPKCNSTNVYSKKVLIRIAKDFAMDINLRLALKMLSNFNCKFIYFYVKIEPEVNRTLSSSSNDCAGLKIVSDKNFELYAQV